MSSILSYSKSEAKESDDLRMFMLNKYEELHYNDVDSLILDVIKFVNSITNQHFKKRSLISYLPVFDELYYTSIKIEKIDVIKNINSINSLTKRAEAKIFKTKIILSEIDDAVENSRLFLVKVNDQKLKLEVFSENNKKDLSIMYASSVATKKNMLNKIIDNIEQDITRIENKKTIIELKIINYENFIKSQVPLWINLYSKLGDDCSNSEIKMFLNNNKVALEVNNKGV